VHVSSDDNITFRDVPINNYDNVEIGNGFNAFITFSDDEESVQVEANSNLQHLIIAKISNNTLIVKMKNNVNVKGNPTLNVYISTKSIENFKATADSNIILENILVTNDAYISLSADSSFSGELDVENLDLRATADVTADLYGYVSYLNANLSADVRLSDYDLVVDDLKLKMFADCDAHLTINNTIYVDGKADCVLNYKGNATIIYKDLKADSKIRKMD
jgi:hypothetical protein